MARELHPVPVPASDEPVYEIDSFEMLWEQHKGKIIGGTVAIVVLLVAVFGWLIVSHNKSVAAERAFGGAKTAAEYQAVVENYPSSPVAGPAALLLASSLRGEKKYDEANAVLDRFARAQPESTFAPVARIAAATNLSLAGKAGEAEKALQSVAMTDSKSFAAPYALLVEAETKAAEGDRAGALKAYRELAKTFPESVAARATAQVYQAMESLDVQAPVPAAPGEVAATPEP